MLWLNGLLSASFSVRAVQQSDMRISFLNGLTIHLENEA